MVERPQKSTNLSPQRTSCETILIENFFAKLKQYRAIATRYDKRACNFLGAIYLAASVITLN
jgi:transposase